MSLGFIATVIAVAVVASLRADAKDHDVARVSPPAGSAVGDELDLDDLSRNDPQREDGAKGGTSRRSSPQVCVVE